MSHRTFVKHYADPGRRAAAERHYSWLARHASPIRQPALIAVESTRLTFEHINGRHAIPSDLPRLAALMGEMHGAAWISDLHGARLDRPHGLTPAGGGVIPDFVTCRETALRARLTRGHLPDEQSLDRLTCLLNSAARGPVAFYKDSNPRNVLVTENDVIYTVDTDDLTLAPFGYDLAKLFTTLAMTYGDLADVDVDAALREYNRAAGRHHPCLGRTGGFDIDRFRALHAVLTAPYIGLGGYRFSPEEGA